MSFGVGEGQRQSLADKRRGTPPAQFIVRPYNLACFLNLYAVRVDTSLGFELCPADVCQVGDAFCPVGESTAVNDSSPVSASPRFRIVRDFADPIIYRYRQFIADNGIGIAGIEFISDAAGEIYTYDVNTNTNYNPAAEAEAGKYGMGAIARYLGDELRRIDSATRRSPALAGSV